MVQLVSYVLLRVIDDRRGFLCNAEFDIPDHDGEVRDVRVGNQEISAQVVDVSATVW